MFEYTFSGQSFKPSSSQHNDNEDSDDESIHEQDQSGFGLKRKHHNDIEFIKKVADVVAQKISNNQSELNPEIPLIEPTNSSTVLPYDNIVLKNDETDDFDEKRLISLIPSGYKKRLKNY
jgi:hypothetical protein